MFKKKGDFMKLFLLLPIGLVFLAKADQQKETVDTLESKVSFAGNTLHKIEFDGPRGHEVHYFHVRDKEAYYVCSKSCLEPNRTKLQKNEDQLLSAEKSKNTRHLKVFEELKTMCGSPTESPSIHICEIANAPNIQGYSELTNSVVN
jgi:hypothetical protein